MTTYSATVALSGGNLTVTRPHPSTDDVDSIVDGLVFSVRDPESPVTSIGVTIVTGDGPQPVQPPLPDGQLTTDDTGQHAAGDDTATANVTGPLPS